MKQDRANFIALARFYSRMFESIKNLQDQLRYWLVP